MFDSIPRPAHTVCQCKSDEEEMMLMHVCCVLQLIFEAHVYEIYMPSGN